MAGSLTARTLARPSFESAFEPPAFIAAMLAFESALAQAQAAEGLVPAESARAIAAACDRMRIDARTLVEEGKRSATLAVPLVTMLKDEVAAPLRAHHPMKDARACPTNLTIYNRFSRGDVAQMVRAADS